MIFQSATALVRSLNVLLKELSLPRFGILFLTVVCGIALWAMWEQRQAVFITVTGSVFAMFAIGFGLSMILTALISGAFYLAERRRNEDDKKEMKGEITRLHDLIDKVVADERRQCDEKMALQEKRLQDFIIATRMYPRHD